MDEDALKAAVRREPLMDRLKKARKMIGKMCSEGRPPKMSIPVDYEDEDFFIGTTLMDTETEVERLRKIEDAVIKDRDSKLDFGALWGGLECLAALEDNPRPEDVS